MNKKEILNRHQILARKYQKKNSVDIITTEENRYVLKNGNYYAVYEYLGARNFHNIPKIFSGSEDSYTLYQYIEDYAMPKEQRIEDFIYLLSILHTKTTFYKTLELEKIKEIFENIRSKQDYLINYYQNLQNMIEAEKYMSPSHYQLIRNLSMIYFHLTESKIQIEKWYNRMKDNKKMRYAMTHGNLESEHFIENQDLFLISWNKARMNSPVYDLENFYRNNWREITLEDLLGIYQSKYSLNNSELHLFLSLIHMPEKIEFQETEIENIRVVHELIKYHIRLEEWKQKTSKKENHPG